MDDEDLPPDDLPLVELGRYGRLAQARERGLVLSAMDVPHWIVRQKPLFVLCVEERWREVALNELEKYEAESRLRPPAEEPESPSEKFSAVSLYVAAWVMGAFWFAQNYLPRTWVEHGQASSGRIVRQHEWWRTLTALTLHGDLSHFTANLVVGLLFASFLIRLLGSGFTWLAIVLSGALGNALNAWFYQAESHNSIGASTAVFGALGLLAGGESIARLSSAHTRHRWQLILPLGAGLGLLAFLGAGGEHSPQTDSLAHLWGFTAGLVLGALAAGLKLKQRAPRALQRAAALAAPALLALAWWRAMAR